MARTDGIGASQEGHDVFSKCKFHNVLVMINNVSLTIPSTHCHFLIPITIDIKLAQSEQVASLIQTHCPHHPLSLEKLHCAILCTDCQGKYFFLLCIVQFAWLV